MKVQQTKLFHVLVFFLDRFRSGSISFFFK